jgi:hypothetical protein
MLAASRKQHVIVTALSCISWGRSHFRVAPDINQGGNRIVERCRALFEAGINKTTERRC